MGHPRGDRFGDVLTVAAAAVNAGTASFPLDTSRYMETSKRGNWQSRQELVETMAQLSRFHTLAPQTVVLPPEIDAALHDRFGRPEIPRTAQVFGVGVGHALGSGIETAGRLRLPDGVDIPAGYRAQLDAALQATLEYAALLGPTPDMQNTDEHRALLARMTQDMQFARGRAELAERLTEHGFDGKERLDRAMLATQLQDILEPVIQALVHAGIHPDWFFKTMGQEGLTEFVKDLPTRAVTVDLLRDKHAQGQQTWEPNDLNDVVTLPIAAVYCDIVVTERQWRNRMERVKVPGRYGTVLLSDLAELTEVLVAATRTG